MIVVSKNLCAGFVCDVRSPPTGCNASWQHSLVFIVWWFQKCSTPVLNPSPRDLLRNKSCQWQSNPCRNMGRSFEICTLLAKVGSYSWHSWHLSRISHGSFLSKKECGEGKCSVSLEVKGLIFLPLWPLMTIIQKVIYSDRWMLSSWLLYKTLYIGTKPWSYYLSIYLFDF